MYIYMCSYIHRTIYLIYIYNTPSNPNEHGGMSIPSYDKYISSFDHCSVDLVQSTGSLFERWEWD